MSLSRDKCCLPLAVECDWKGEWFFRDLPDLGSDDSFNGCIKSVKQGE